jgi:hypothetical protein
MQSTDLRSALVGEWHGTKQLYLEPPPAAPKLSHAALTVTSIAGGNFLQFNYTWTFDDEQQTGVLLFGYDDEHAASAAWVDSFHMSSKIFLCTGTVAECAAQMRGSYAAPPGPDWGWTIAIRSISATEFQILMHNISPEGQEDLAVQIDCKRST